MTIKELKTILNKYDDNFEVAMQIDINIPIEIQEEFEIGKIEKIINLDIDDTEYFYGKQATYILLKGSLNENTFIGFL